LRLEVGANRRLLSPGGHGFASILTVLTIDADAIDYDRAWPSRRPFHVARRALWSQRAHEQPGRLVVVHAGYSAAFPVLAGIAASGFLLYFSGMPKTRDIAERESDPIAPAVQSR